MELELAGLGFFKYIIWMFLLTGVIWGIVVAVKQVRFKEGQVVQQWDTLIDQGNGKADVIYEAIDNFLKSVNPPDVKLVRENIHAGDFMTGRDYDGLRIVDSYLRDYRIYIFAYDYGTSLHVAWFLTYQKTIVKLAKRMDIPQQLQLNAYVSTIHGATKSGVQTLMESLEQDFSKVNTKSKGFLEVW
jgi:hypothetical protein